MESSYTIRRPSDARLRSLSSTSPSSAEHVARMEVCGFQERPAWAPSSGCSLLWAGTAVALWLQRPQGSSDRPLCPAPAPSSSHVGLSPTGSSCCSLAPPTGRPRPRPACSQARGAGLVGPAHRKLPVSGKAAHFLAAWPCGTSGAGGRAHLPSTPPAALRQTAMRQPADRPPSEGTLDLGSSPHLNPNRSARGVAQVPVHGG